MILLGITTLLSAWVSWIAHLHGGLQSINFTQSNNSASEATAQYNYAIQSYLADYMAWNTLRDYQYELDVAKAEGNQTKTAYCASKAAMDSAVRCLAKELSSKNIRKKLFE